jgi:predicted DsbA family dithiol-disulfide isomerase
VEVWHDTVCPWCRIGLHNLGVALDAWKGAPVDVAIHPFLLNPDAPKEGTDLRAHLSEKFGVGADSVFGQVSRAGARYGVHFNWDKVRISPNSLSSHALISACPKPLQRALLDGIHRAYFEEGKNIGDADTLVEIARAAGLDGGDAVSWIADSKRISDIRLEARSAVAAGVQGVPYFRFGPQPLEGAQSTDALREALESLATG